MKDRRGGAGVFPFSIGCMSQSAVSVADPHEKISKPPNEPAPSSSSSSAAAVAQKGVEEEGGSAAAPGSMVPSGVQRLMRGIKQSLTQMFAAYDGAGEEEEDEEREMVIGFPTDVQHVGHIGWDGGRSKVGSMAMVNAFSLPSSLSLRQLEMAMEPTHA